jgi:hypothetical protein
MGKTSTSYLFFLTVLGQHLLRTEVVYTVDDRLHQELFGLFIEGDIPVGVTVVHQHLISGNQCGHGAAGDLLGWERVVRGGSVRVSVRCVEGNTGMEIPVSSSSRHLKLGLRFCPDSFFKPVTQLM